MTALLTGLWAAVLVLSLVRLCQRRRAAPPVIVLPVVIVSAEPVDDPEAWLRKQLEGLGKP